MARLNAVAKAARIAKNKAGVASKLAHRIVDTDNPEFADLVTEKGKKMTGLNGAIILGKDLREDGSLKGVFSVDVDDLASMLPDIKADIEDKMGWGKHRAVFEAEGINILEGVDDPTPDEFDLSMTEDLAQLNIPAMSDYEAKQKLLELQQRWVQEG